MYKNSKILKYNIEMIESEKIYSIEEIVKILIGYNIDIIIE